jgi:hypothetical protein
MRKMHGLIRVQGTMDRSSARAFSYAQEPEMASKVRTPPASFSGTHRDPADTRGR